jgi:YbgC/YbaW family acyl-CoA thioester hydrolase
MQLFEYELVIKEHHLDSYGHVNNATYLTLYEEARWEMITLNGYGYNKVQEIQIGPVILEAHVKFSKELKLREKIKINMQLVSYEGKISKLKQQMINDKQQVASELIVTVGLFDLKERKLLRPTPEWLKAIGYTA